MPPYKNYSKGKFFFDILIYVHLKIFHITKDREIHVHLPFRSNCSTLPFQFKPKLSTSFWLANPSPFWSMFSTRARERRAFVKVLYYTVISSDISRNVPRVTCVSVFTNLLPLSAIEMIQFVILGKALSDKTSQYWIHWVNLNKSIVVTFLENVGCGFQNFAEEILQHNEKARCNIVEYTTAFQYFD